jgi:hypothetical protein
LFPALLGNPVPDFWRRRWFIFKAIGAMFLIAIVPLVEGDLGMPKCSSVRQPEILIDV